MIPFQSYLDWRDYLDTLLRTILNKETRWSERGVREAVYALFSLWHVRAETPSLNRGEGLSHNLSHVYDPAIKRISGRVDNKGNTASATLPNNIEAGFNSGDLDWS